MHVCIYQYPHVYTYAYMYNAMWQTVYINLLIHVCAEGLHFSALFLHHLIWKSAGISYSLRHIHTHPYSESLPII